MRRFALVVGVLSLARPAEAQLIVWSPSSFSGTPVRAQINGGPWTLGTDGDYPAPNVGTSAFEPDYQPSVTMTAGGVLQGLFDYRPEELEEAVLAASSLDGVNWTFEGEAFDFADAGSDDGQGHPFALSVGNTVYLYTLDRTPTEVDYAQLLVYAMTPTTTNLLAGLPVAQMPVPAPGTAGSIRTVGLLNPDGIIGVVPGASPVEVLYVQKQLAIADGADLTTVRLATTADGVTFTDLGAVSGLIDSCVGTPSSCVTSSSVTYVSSRGTLFAITDASGTRQAYGLLFSAGLWGEDSDAFHFVGYAESTNLTTWTVYNGLGTAPSAPLLSIDGDDLSPPGQDTGSPLSWYQSRVYAPSAVPDVTGCASLNLIFSGYSASAKTSDDYRQVGQVGLDLSGTGYCAVLASLETGSSTASTLSSSASTASSSSAAASSGSTGTSGSTSSSNSTGSASTASATATGGSLGASGSGSSGTNGAGASTATTAASTASGTTASTTSSTSGSIASSTSGPMHAATAGATSGAATTGSAASAPPASKSDEWKSLGCTTSSGGFSAMLALLALGMRAYRRSEERQS